ncbi:MAG: two-component sensor histidine kinase [Thermus sp.]|uniref:sensor histidine kinase n=1 Tax=Thermus sp. TaxID=275 RepID=UPI00331E0602
MRLFARLLLAFLLVVLLAQLILLVSAEALAPYTLRGHIANMERMMGPMGLELRTELESGLRFALSLALLLSVPIANLLSMGTAYFISRQIGKTVWFLAEGSRAIARGNYAQRLPVLGRGDELSELAQAFNQMAEALEGVEKGRVELIATVAHELRTPLSAIRGYAEALQDEALPKEEGLLGILRELKAMERLVADLSWVSRVEVKAVELRPEALEPERLLKDAEERFLLAFQEKGVALLRRAEAGLPLVWADRERVGQVFSNLLTNALRHTPQGGRVVLGAERAPEGVRFFVQDTGPGVPEAYRERVFERFFRLDPARSRQEGGSGVGLTVAKGLVEAMGGWMGLESEVGRGSRFYFTLPLWREGLHNLNLEALR